MATLERIRSKGGILVAVVIGLSLLAFILGDLFDSRKSILGSSSQNVGEVNGKSIPIQDLEQKITEITEIYKMNSGKENLDEATSDGIREQAWMDLINEGIYGREFKKIGLTVSGDELFDQMQGANPHAIIKQIFTDPQTGMFNKPALLQFLKGTNDANQVTDQRKFRIFLETEIRKDRINAKYLTLVKKGLSVPGFIAKNANDEMVKKSDFDFVMLPYTGIADNTVAVSTDDLKSYYKKHKYQYLQPENSRDCEYVTFDVKPSNEDYKSAEDWIKKIKPELAAAAEVEQFVNTSSDVPYQDINYKQSDLPDSIGAAMFKGSAGLIAGPYFDKGSFKLARLYKVVSVPDSVKARHILITPAGQTKQDHDKATATADSLKKLIEKGADFAALAAKYSKDRSNAEKGGDLNWFKEGMMVKPFNDAAFESKKGDVKVVETQFGIHILQVLERGKESKKVKIAFIERKVEASSQTYQKVYAAAMKFASENRTIEKFNQTANKQGLIKMQAYGMGINDKKLQTIEHARSIVKWAFNAKQGDISEPIDIGGSQYVVASLVSVRDKGTLPFDVVKSDVEVAVRKEKKAKILIEKLNTALAGAKTIQDLGLKVASPVQTAGSISFSSYAVPYAGPEPKLVAIIPDMPRMKLSKPIEGENGVFVIFVKQTVQPTGNNYTEARMRINYMLTQSVSYTVYGALKEKAGVEDNRYRFF